MAFVIKGDKPKNTEVYLAEETCGDIVLRVVDLTSEGGYRSIAFIDRETGELVRYACPVLTEFGFQDDCGRISVRNFGE